MEVKASEPVKGRYICLYSACAIVYLLTILLPILWFPIWSAVFGTIVFLLVILFSLRAWFQAVFAMMPPFPLAPLPDDLPTVSIVIPSFNEERVLPRTIPTVLALDYPAEKLEFVYLYESACTDRTEEIIRRFAALDSRIKVVRRLTTNGGKAAATNYALQFATGQIIGIFDADHSLVPDLVRRAVAHLQSPSAGCVRGRCRTINRGQNLLTKVVALERDIVERFGISGAYRYGGFANFGGGHGFFRREIFERFGPFHEEVLTEDIDYSVTLHLAGFEVVFDPQMQSFEEAPPTVAAWFHQRKRWSRGWMQIARRRLPEIVSASIPAVKKIDMTVALLSSLSPVLLVSIVPLLWMALLGVSTSIFPPSLALLLWTFVTLTPVVQAIVTQWFDGATSRKIIESVAVSTLLIPYLIFQMGVGWLAGMDEFVLERDTVYVKTERVLQIHKMMDQQSLSC